MSTSFIQISDCHIDDDKQVMGVDTQAHLENVLDHIKTQTFDALLISGDLTHNGTPSSYQLLKKSLSLIDQSTYVVPGNHDNKTNLSAAFNSDLQGGFQLNDWQIITLDSVQTNKVSGFLDGDQIVFLENSINSSNAKHIIVCLHHPVVSMNSAWDDSLSLENPNDLFDVIGKYSKVRAVLCGHAHHSKRFIQNNISLFSCPSTALQFNGPDKIGYNHFRLHSNGKIDCKTHWL